MFKLGKKKRPSLFPSPGDLGNPEEERRKSIPNVLEEESSRRSKSVSEPDIKEEKVGAGEVRVGTEASDRPKTSNLDVLSKFRTVSKSVGEINTLATSITVPPAARILWLANKGNWAALDNVLRKYLENDEKIDFDPNSNKDDESGMTPLMLACRDNKYSVVEKLLELGSGVNERDKEGRTALYHAVTGGSENIVKVILQAKADTDTVAGEYDRNCLHQACGRISGALEIVRALVRVMGKESKLIPDKAGNLPIHIAVSAGNALVVKELLQSHVHEQLGAMNKEYKDTGLHVAARRKEVDLVKIVVEHGAAVDQRNAEGQTALHIACAEGDDNTVKYLYSVKANPNMYDKLNRTPLHVATEAGHMGVIKILLENFKADVNQRSKDGSTLIHLASKCGHPEVALLYVKKGVPLHMPNKEGAICLHEAAKQGHVSVVKNLLLKGASVNTRTKDQYTALHTAVRHGKHLVVQVLLGFGADVNCKGGKDCEAPLHLAARLSKEAENVSEMLLKSGADVNASNEDGETALHIAIRMGNYDLVKLLLDENANVLIRSKAGESPLHLSMYYCNVAIALEIIDAIQSKHDAANAMAAINQCNEDGETAMHYVSKLTSLGENKGKDVDLAKLLLDRHANGTIYNLVSRESPLHYCSRYGNNDTMRLILSSLPSETAMKAVNQQNKNGWSALLVACEQGRTEVVKTLLEYHARIDIFDENGKTALHIACENGHIPVCEILIMQKAYVNAKTKHGMTAVHLASAAGYKDLVDILINKFNASVEIVTLLKKTPLHLAAAAGKLETCAKLLELHSDAMAVDEAGQTPLFNAAENDHSAVVRLFLTHNPSLVHQTNKDGNTCSHIAAHKGSLEVLKALILSDKNTVNSRNKKSLSTPAHLAAQGGHQEILELLVANGASLEDEDKEGMTPLHLCAKYGHQGLIDLLKGKVPLVNPSIKTGMTPLHVAAEYGQADIVQDMIQKVPAGIQSECPKGKQDVQYGFTPLHLAALNGHEGIVRVLLNSHGVRVDTPTEGKGLIALHMALANGHTSVSSLLLGRSTHQLALKDNDGRTGLHFAAAHGHLELVTLLLGQGAEIDVIDENGWTPLHNAADAGHLQVVKYLVRMGASTTIEDTSGKTPLALSAKNHHLEVMKYLVMRDFDVEMLLLDRKFLTNLMLCSKLSENHSIVDFILNSPAPIYTACKLSRLYRIESGREKDKSQDFENMGEFCEELAFDLLHLATAIRTEDVLNATDDNGQPLLDILIDSELKECVAHQNVQSYLSDVWKGETGLDGWKSIVIFLLCALLPPIWGFLCLPWHRWSTIPTLKFICHIVSHLYLVLILILVIVVPWDRSYEEVFPTPYEWLLLLWLSGILLSTITEPQGRSGLGWLPTMTLVVATIAISIHGIAIFFEGQVREEIMYGRDQVLGLVLFLCIGQSMEFLSLHHLFGPWSIIIRSLVLDLMRFLVILMIFMIGFTLHLCVVYKPVYKLKRTDIPQEVKEIPIRGNPMIIFEDLFFAMFGLTGKEAITNYDPNTNPIATKYIALASFALYEIIAIVVLVNLLIAMMSDTYTRLEAKSDVEWKYGRAKLIRNMTKSRTTPVPMNIVTIAVTCINVIFRTRCCCCKTDIQRICDEMEHKLPESMAMDSFLSQDRPAIMEEGNGAKKLEDVVNWNDIVQRFLQNKGWSMYDSEEDDLTASPNIERKKTRRRTQIKAESNGTA